MQSFTQLIASQPGLDPAFRAAFASKQPVTPQHAELAMVYRDGILDYDAHDAMLRSLGYEYIGGTNCDCGGSEDDGHLPTCGWVKAGAL